MSSTAATIAAATAPPDSSTEATANCADPANVVSDITIGATTPMPASRARIPYEAPNATTATASGAAARAPGGEAIDGACRRAGSVRHNGTCFHDDGMYSIRVDSLSSEMERQCGRHVRSRAVAANVRVAADAGGLTLADLAGAAGLGKSTLAQLESGKAQPERRDAVGDRRRAAACRSRGSSRRTRPALRVVRAADVPPMHSAEAPGWAGRLLTASHGRGTFDLYALDLERAPSATPTPTTPGSSSTSWSSSGACAPARRTGPSCSRPGDLVTFGADVPHVYEALETTHCVLLMAYP